MFGGQASLDSQPCFPRGTCSAIPFCLSVLKSLPLGRQQTTIKQDMLRVCRDAGNVVVGLAGSLALLTPWQVCPSHAIDVSEEMTAGCFFRLACVALLSLYSIKDIPGLKTRRKVARDRSDLLHNGTLLGVSGQEQGESRRMSEVAKAQGIYLQIL